MVNFLFNFFKTADSKDVPEEPQSQNISFTRGKWSKIWIAVAVIKPTYVEVCVCVTGYLYIKSIASGDNSRGNF